MVHRAVIALVPLLAACSAPASISLDSTASDSTPVFLLARRGTSEPVAIAAFRVDACNARGTPPIDTHWLTVAPGEPRAVARIAYGLPPEGWRSAQGPHPLTLGCYRAAIADAPPLEFDVSAGGRATARR
jgi:hypothetical protein